MISPGRPPLAIGDSVLYDAARALANYGFESNAMICRTMGQGIVWLEQNSTNLPSLVVVALGTNGAVTEAQIEQLLTILGPQRLLALVTPHHGNYAYVAGLYRSAAQHNPGRIDLLDWDAFSAGHADWFAPDGIHLGSGTGVDAFAQLVASALLGGPVTATPQPTQRRPPRPRSHRPSAPRAASQTPTQANPGTVTTWLQLFGEIEAYCLVLPRS